MNDLALLGQVFGRVVDNGKMLRNFVQILRSGAVGRKSLGTRPKKLVQQWLVTADRDAAAERSRGEHAFAGRRGEDGPPQICRGLARGLVRVVDRSSLR